MNLLPKVEGHFECSACRGQKVHVMIFSLAQQLVIFQGNTATCYISIKLCMCKGLVRRKRFMIGGQNSCAIDCKTLRFLFVYLFNTLLVLCHSFSSVACATKSVYVSCTMQGHSCHWTFVKL